MPFHQGLTRAQGDPGFFSFLGKVAKTVTQAIPGPVGAIARTIFDGRGRPVPVQRLQAVPRPAVPVPGIVGAAQRFFPGGETGFECPPGAACPKGMRLNKSAYFLKDGTFVMPGTRCVKVRRINAGNGKAVRRAIRRENAFVRLAVGTGLVRVPRAKRVRKAAGK